MMVALCDARLPFLPHLKVYRDDRIRTCGPFVPNEVRYQAAPHPDQVILEDGLPQTRKTPTSR
jgi:hypothetical protein